MAKAKLPSVSKCCQKPFTYSIYLEEGNLTLYSYCKKCKNQSAYNDFGNNASFSFANLDQFEKLVNGK